MMNFLHILLVFTNIVLFLHIVFYFDYRTILFFLHLFFYVLLYFCVGLTLLTRAKCGVCSTLYWKVGNISGST